MATEQANVVYTADTTQYNRSMAESIAMTEKYAMVVDNAAGKIAKAGITLSRTVMNRGPFGTGKEMSPAVEVAAQYEQQLSLLGARAKVAGQGIGQLGRDVRGLARDFPIGMGTAVQQFESLQRAGKSGDELRRLTQDMTKLGAATGEMGSGLTQSMTQFSRTFEQFNSKGVQNLSDSVTKLSSTFGASATSIVDFSNAIAPLGKTIGMSATDVLGFSTAFSRAGEDGYRAANVFNKMLSDMERAMRTGAPQVRGYAEAIGMTSEQFTSLAKEDATEAMTQFIEAIGSKGSEGIRILEDLGLDGVRSLKSIKAVADSGDLRKMIEESGKALGSGATEEGAKEAFDGLNDSLQKTSESMNQLVEASAKPMLGMMGDLANQTAKVTSAFASFAQSPAVQSAVTIMTVAGGVLGAGKMAVSAASLIGGGKQLLGGTNSLVSRISGSGIGAAGQRYSGALKTGGMLGIGAGLAMGNPMLAALGAGSMFLGPGMDRLRAYEERGGTMGGAARGAARRGAYGAWWLTDMFYGGVAGTERMRDLVGSKERGGRMYDRQMRAMQRQAGLTTILGPDVTRDGQQFYSAERQKEIMKARSDEVKRIIGEGSRAERMALARRTAMSIPGSTMRTLGSVGGALIPGLGAMGVAGGVVAGAAGIGVTAYMMNKQIREAKEGPSSLEDFAQKTGIAAKGLESLTTQLKKMEEGVTTLTDAVKVSEDDIKAASNPEYKATYKPQQDRSNEQIAAEMMATYGKQSPQMIQRVKTDLLSQGMGSDEVQKIMDIFEQGTGKGYNPYQAAVSTNKTNRSGWDAFFEGSIGWYPGKNEAIQMAKSAAQNANVARAEYESVYGPTAGRQYAVQTQLPQAVEAAMGSTDIDVRREMLTSAMPDATKDEVEQILNNIDEARRLMPNATAAEQAQWAIQGGQRSITTTRGVGGGGGSFGSQLASSGQEVTTKMALPETDYYKTQIEELNKATEANKGALNALLEAGSGGGISTQNLKEALDIAKTAGEGGAPLPLPELLAEYDKAKEEGRPTALTPGQAAAARAYAYQENVSAQQSLLMTNIEGERGRYQRGQFAPVDFGAQIQALESYRAEHGEIDPAVIREITRGVDARMAAITMETGGSLSQGQATIEKFRIATSLEQGTDVSGQKIYSTDQELAELQNKGTQMRQEVETQVAQQQRGLLMAEYNRQKQTARGEEDMNRSIANMQADAAKNASRAREDFARQEKYATADFRKQQLRAQEDFNRSRADAEFDYQKQMSRGKADFDKSMARSNEDYQKSVNRATQDYQKQRSRATEDFAKQQKRQAEAIARDMLDPFSRVSAQRSWGTGGLIGNLEQQNKFVKEQLDVVDALRERGLSQDVIDTLKMTDANNAMQVRSMSEMTDEEIARLNEEVGERFNLGERLSSPENNLGMRQAEEDFALSMERMATDFEEAMARGAEDFTQSQTRAVEDYNLSVTRSAEDFNLSMERSLRDYQISVERSVVDFQTSMDRQREAMQISLARSAEDVAISASRMRTEFGIAAERSRQDIIDTYNELTGMDIGGEARKLLEGHTVNFKGFMDNSLLTTMNFIEGETTGTMTGVETTTESATGDVETAVGDMDSATEEALGNVESNAEDAFGTVKTEGVDAFDEVKVKGVEAMDGLIGKIQTASTEMTKFLTNTRTSSVDAMNVANTTAVTLINTATVTMGTVISKFETAMGDYAWLFQQETEAVRKELVLKFDQQSFDQTFGIALGDADTKKPGYQVPDYGSGNGPGGGGPVNTKGASVPMIRYGNFFSDRLGDSKMKDTRDGKMYDVFHHCLRNAIEGWLQSSEGNKLVIGRLPTAAIHANRVKGQMNPGYAAPAGSLYWWDSSIGGGAGHVAVADGYGNAMNNWGGHVIEKNKVNSMAPKAYMGWTSPHTSLYKGGIAVKPTAALVAEAGPEAVVPLNEDGARLLARTLEHYQNAPGMAEQRTAQYTIDLSTHTSTVVNDSSVHTGPVTVVSDNADRMAEQLRARQRRQRLGSKV